MENRTLNPLLFERILTKYYEDTAKNPQRVIITRSNKNRLPACVHTNHLHNQSGNWCLAGLLNIDASSSGVKESNSNPVTYSTNSNYCKNARSRYSNSAVTLIEQSPLLSSYIKVHIR